MGKNLEKPISRSKVSEPKSERAGRKRRVYMKGFQPTDWLSSIKPHKLPFYPQVGDEVMYFRQGHEMYAAAVKQNHLYDISPSSLPWTKQIIRQQEWVKIIDINYEIKPPRLICLKLGLVDPISGLLTRKCFSVKYHDIDDVPDFLVLKQDYDKAVKRPWKRSQQFRSLMNDDCGVQMWWEGKFIKRDPLDAKFPESMFLCYCVRWDNGDSDRLSPWDLESIDPVRRPYMTGASVHLLPIEISSMLYTAQAYDWPPLGDRDFECDRISGGISKVMSLNEAKHFSAPVNLELFPTYAFVVKYPMDLSTIKARLDNRFYRRAVAVEYDVRRIRINALKFNDPEKSYIVRNSSIISDLCLEIIRNSDLDITKLYHQLLEEYKVHGIEGKGLVGKQPVANHQIEQSASFALTFTNVVTGSSQTSTSRQKLVFNPTHGSSSLVASNHASVKVSSSVTVEPIADVDLTTDNYKTSDSLTLQNSRNYETTNTSRMKKKVTSPVGVEFEQSLKRRKTTPVIAPTALYGDEQFSFTTTQECDSSVSTHLNQNTPTKTILKRKSMTKEYLDITCTTSSSLPRMDGDGSLVVNAGPTTESFHSHNDRSSIGIGEENSAFSQNEIFSPGAMDNHLNVTRIPKTEINSRLKLRKNSLFSVPITPFLTPMPIAISTPIRVRQRTSPLFGNNSLKKSGKHASKSLFPRNLFSSEKRINIRKFKLDGWSISLHDFPERISHTLKYPILKDKSPRTSLPQQGPLSETVELRSSFHSNNSYQCPKVETTSSPSVTRETVLIDFNTKSKQKGNHTQVEDPPASFANPSIQSSTFLEESESSSFQSVDVLIEQILAESKLAFLKQKTKKKKKKSEVCAFSRLSKLEKDCQERFTAKLEERQNYIQDNALGHNTHSVFPDDNESSLSQSTEELIEQILAESKRIILKEKNSKKSEKKTELSAVPRMSKGNNDYRKPLQAKSEHRKNHTEVEYSPASNAIPVEEDQNQSVLKEFTLTPTNFVDNDSCELDRTTSTPKEKLLCERQVIFSTNKRTYKEKKPTSSEAIDGNQQSVFPEESELPSSHSADEPIGQILAESKRVVKQKSSRKQSENRNESKVCAISRLSMLEKDCQDPPKRKPKHGNNRTRITEASLASTIPLEDDEKQVLNKASASKSRHILNFHFFEKDRLTITPNRKFKKANVASKKSDFIGKKAICKLTIGRFRRSAFAEEEESSFPQSDDAIVQQILAESKLSIPKQKTSKRRKSDTSRSSMKKKECHNIDKYLGSRENRLRSSRPIKNYILARQDQLQIHQSERDILSINQEAYLT